VVESRAVWKDLGSRRIGKSLEGVRVRNDCYGSRLKGLSQEATLVLSNTRELDRVFSTK